MEPKVLMYNIANQEMREVSENEVDRAIAGGWRKINRYDLVSVYNPNLKEHKAVLRSDVNTWINMGYYAEPTVVYHPELGARTVSSIEASHLMENGWYDSPAKFPKNDAQAVVERAVKEYREERPTQVAFGGTQPVEPLVKPLVKMSKAELVAHAIEAHGLELVPDNMTVKQMIAAIEAATSDKAA